MANVAFHIPLFPLGVFLLPGEQTGLHIFEPRYRQLIAELEDAMMEGREKDNRFGIPFHHDNLTASTGSLAKLVEVKKVHPGGRKDIVVECVGHFETRRFESISSPKLYPAGQVVARDIGLDSELNAQHIALVIRIKEILADREVDVSELPSCTISDVTSWLGLPPAHKHRLLTSNPVGRSVFLESVLRWTLSILQQESRIDKGYFPN
ncbi:MAG: hypothetical protein CL849_05480 [Crocinitomicaceae bacterium]|nr:hypothetical protein [Crocinitomicaceae bacterium]